MAQAFLAARKRPCAAHPLCCHLLQEYEVELNVKEDDEEDQEATPMEG